MIVDHELLVQWAFSRAGAAARLVMRDWRRVRCWDGSGVSVGRRPCGIAWYSWL